MVGGGRYLLEAFGVIVRESIISWDDQATNAAKRFSTLCSIHINNDMCFGADV